MKRIEIQERIEAILEDLFGSPKIFSMGDELESYFDPEEFAAFADMVEAEFGVSALDVEEQPNFFALIELIGDEIN